ncbi:merozoite surface protein 8, putative [Plasmodium ovale wallikeri]|uniref:Merozoite surface protein 8 n=1 Tax=Plasmodium ovale wallikeri TaxID=864142 RepID=A0A1A9AM26_PLAOA|nr:merozoite surface protein 8 [Plasmodium ovale wallikeri]SBT36674.1 merozoite surface protein 8, putative [Plasmodium ovale wallikeri]SBT57264.1 merozoite surface protein 8, putative [Plasmodium ovale wallikeri]
MVMIMKKNSYILIFLIFSLIYYKNTVEGNIDISNGNGIININNNDNNGGNGNDKKIPPMNTGGNNDNMNKNNNVGGNDNGNNVNDLTNNNLKDNSKDNDENKNKKENNDNESKGDDNDNKEDNNSEKNDESLKKILNIVDEMENIQELLDGNSNILDKYNIKLVDEEDGDSKKKKLIGEYDLKMIKKVLLFREKISRTCENNFMNVNVTLKKCFNKDDPKLSKSCEKIKRGLSKNNMSIEDFILGLLEDLFDKINDNFIQNDSFDLNDYLADFELINYLLLHESTELLKEIIHIIDAINFKVESDALTKISNSAYSGMNINDKIKDDITNLLKMPSAKFFKIGVDKKTKMLIPVQAQHKGSSMKQFAYHFLDKNKVCEHTKCPLNSNCYVIDAEETCRCLPGFSDVKIDNVMNCVRDDTIDCSNNNGGCDVNATCSLIDKKIVCECKENFEGDGIYCSNSILNSINCFIFLIIVILCLYLF